MPPKGNLPGASESNSLSLFPPLSLRFYLLVVITLISLSLSLFHLKSHLFYSCHSPWLDPLSICQTNSCLCLYLAWAGTDVGRTVCSPPVSVYPGKCGGVCGRGGRSHVGGTGPRSCKEPALPSVPTLPAGPAHQSSAITMETSSRLPIGGQEGRGEGRAGSPLLTPLF